MVFPSPKGLVSFTGTYYQRTSRNHTASILKLTVTTPKPMGSTMCHISSYGGVLVKVTNRRRGWI